MATGREEQLELMGAMLPNDPRTAPRVLLIHGPPSTGKSHTLIYHLRSTRANYSIIECDQCISSKILYKRVIQALYLSVAKGKTPERQTEATASFQGFLRALQEFISRHRYTKLHYLVLDRVDQIMEGEEEVLECMSRLHEVMDTGNICVVFVSNTVNRVLVTSSIPAVIFDNYKTNEIIEILTNQKICSFPVGMMIGKKDEAQFYAEFVGLVVQSFLSYTTDLLLLKRIMVRLWPKFIMPIIKGDCTASEFHKVFRANRALLMSEYGVTENTIDETMISENTSNSNLSTISKYLLIASYLASFNDSKQDWLVFSKTRTLQRRTTYKRKGKINARLLEASAFDLERLIAITHSIYEASQGKKLESNLDLVTQVANLGSLKLLLKTGNIDYITSKVRWKCNVREEVIRELAREVGLGIEEYLDH